jgi:hypothetical protein
MKYGSQVLYHCEGPPRLEFVLKRKHLWMGGYARAQQPGWEQRVD